MEIDPAEALKERRQRIDEVDRAIVALLNQRTRIVEDVGRIKKTGGYEVCEPVREEAVMANAARHNDGPIPQDALRRIYEKIMEEMRAIQAGRMQG